MRVSTPRILLFFLIVGLALAAPFGCKSGGGHHAVTADVVPGQVAGTWDVSVTHSVQTSCSEAPNVETFHMNVVQDGNNLTITTDNGYSATGTIDGSRVTFTYSFPDGGGTTTSMVTLDFESLLGGGFVLDAFAGTGSYTWTDGTLDCDGTDDWSGARLPDGPTGEGLTGAWNLTLSSASTTCADNPQDTVTVPVTVVETGSDVTISIPGLAEFTGVLNDEETELTIFGEYQDPDFFVVASGILTVSADQNTVSGPIDYQYFDLDDPSNDCSGVVDWLMERISGPPPVP